ncbi:PP2C family protein-serine/threonine phosphatase [Microbispora sp. ATCC PTA-5024]|uniref:PP2C family protein-serine/threonine phosphatase n=1 Tax=Microbispora sp. ATCC PTA-5024 TaxID=316330 RepID=UPI0003DB8BA4|nr:PP2C family protein-serine/threonine phosphatase [Microbispora sp. ATCC PTA-5024]ETK37980.1 hypothetical protein MPTA5024_01140 [Microbispora sp. ATCC PTA-5024]
MVGVVGGAQPPLPPADDREPDTAPPGAAAGTLPPTGTPGTDGLVVAGPPGEILSGALPGAGRPDPAAPPAPLQAHAPAHTQAAVQAALPAAVPAVLPAHKAGGVRSRARARVPLAQAYGSLVAQAQRLGDMGWAEWRLPDSRRVLAETREKAAEERHVALALRQAVLPEPGGSFELPYARIAVRYVPAGKPAGLGGDWYEAAALPDGRMFLAVGDVSGHGLPAIAEMAQLRHALLGLTMTGASPGLLLAWLNALVLNRLDDTTATVVCGHFDAETRLFTWAQAGHPAPILVRRGGARRLSAPRGVVLGASPDVRYAVADVRLLPGDVLLMFTDGLVERRTRDIEEGLSLIEGAAGAIIGADGDLDAGLDRLVEAIGGPNPEDDTCLLAVQVSEGGGDLAGQA